MKRPWLACWDRPPWQHRCVPWEDRRHLSFDAPTWHRPNPGECCKLPLKAYVYNRACMYIIYVSPYMFIRASLYFIYTYARIYGEVTKSCNIIHFLVYHFLFGCLKTLPKISFFGWSLWLNHSQPSNCTCVCEHLVWAEKPIWIDICVSLGIAINAWQAEFIWIHHPLSFATLKGRCVCGSPQKLR